MSGWQLPDPKSLVDPAEGTVSTVAKKASRGENTTIIVIDSVFRVLSWCEG